MRAPGWRALLAPALATAIALAILLALGFWQLQRLEWKTALIASIQDRAFGEPAPLPPRPEWRSWSAAAHEFRLLRASGQYEPRVTIPVRGLAEIRRGEPVQGFYLFSPLRLESGSVVMVLRDFAPGLRAPAEAPPASPQAVVGVARAPESRGWFVPANDPGRGEWFVRDVGAMAQYLGLYEDVAPFYLAPPPAGPGSPPRLGQTPLAIPNSHLGYALTWFGLALTLLGVFASFAWNRLHPGSGDELQPQNAGDDQAYAGEPERGRRIAE